MPHACAGWCCPGAGLAVLLAETVFFSDLIPRLGFWRYFIYLVWVLVAIPVIRERAPEGRSALRPLHPLAQALQHHGQAVHRNLAPPETTSLP